MEKAFSIDRVAVCRRPSTTYILLTIAGIIHMMVGPGGALAQELGQLERPLQAAGYQLYNPPRANWGPGFVFGGDIANGRITNVEEICPCLYAGVGSPHPQNTAVILADYNASNAFSFQLAIDFLKRLLGESLNIGRIERDRTVDVKWQNVRELSYTHMDQWLKTGEPRPIEKRCLLAIEDLKAKGRFKDRIFVIVRALAPEVLIYNFKRAAAVETGVSVKFTEQLKAAVQGKGEIKNDTQLEIKQPLFIGSAPPVKIEDWLPTGLVSGEIVKVRGSTTSLLLK